MRGLAEGPVAVGFAVIHPMQLSSNLAEVVPGKLAQRTSHCKHIRSALCQNSGLGFAAFVVETLGTWSTDALSLTQTLAREVAVRLFRWL